MTIKGEKWSSSDVASLKARYEDGESIEQIAAAMGRTSKAVKSVIFRNSLKRR